jgi:DNA (cytosine-5)-methyltransferase 1
VSRPRLLDLFCGDGGASMGYVMAGFDVTGVDISPRPRYPFTFVQGDATTYPLDGFDALAGSPPCNDHSTLSFLAGKHDTGWMLAHTVDRFRASGLPWAVENVETADLPGATLLCGTHFGLGAEGRVLKRHRKFLTSFEVPHPGPCICRGMPVGGVYGDGGGGRVGKGHKFHAAASRHAMGIDWMDRRQLSQSIPPAYTQYIGAAMITAVHDNCDYRDPKAGQTNGDNGGDHHV